MTACSALLILTGCTPTASSDEPSTASGSSSAPTAQATTAGVTVPDSVTQVLGASLTPDVSDDDFEWDSSSEVTIALSDTGSTGGAGVSVDGSTVTVTKPGTYRVSGTLSDGQLVVDASGIVRLVLDQAAITNSRSAALVANEADKLVIVLTAGTANTLTDATEYVYPDASTTEPDAALFSKVDMVIAGEGKLSVNGRYADAIASKDGLVIAGADVTVTAKDDGIRGRDYLVISGGKLAVTSVGQGLKSTNNADEGAGYILVSGGTVDVVTTGDKSDCVNSVTNALFTAGTLTLSCTDDAIHADKLLMVTGGSITVTKSYEGLESAIVDISGGKLDITSSDDTINANDGSGGREFGQRPGTTQDNGQGTAPSANPAAPGGTRPGRQPGAGRGAFPTGGTGGGNPAAGRGGGGESVQNASIDVSGGEITVNAGGDGFDSNGTLTISGGTVVASGANRAGDGALDSNGSMQVSGGTLAAIGGASRMLRIPDETSPQLWFSQEAAIQAGDTVTITTNNGTFTFVAAKEAQSIVFSSPDLASGGVSLQVGNGTSITPVCHGG